MHIIFLFKSSGSIETFLFESIKCCLDNNGDCKMSIGTRMSGLKVFFIKIAGYLEHKISFRDLAQIGQIYGIKY